MEKESGKEIRLQIDQSHWTKDPKIGMGDRNGGIQKALMGLVTVIKRMRGIWYACPGKVTWNLEGNDSRSF